MPTPENFATYTQWSGLAVLFFAALTGLAFVLRWGFRFRLVGVTGFMGVMTVGLFALTLAPLSRTAVPGSVPYSLVYDTGGGEAVIAVSPEITRSQLVATLQQAAGSSFSPGRLGRADNTLTVRARTVVHPEEGISVPLYLGEVNRSLSQRNDPNAQIIVFEENLVQLPQSDVAGSAR
jgi:hypothetical protein